MPKQLLRHAQQDGGGDEVTMKLLLYSLHSVMVLFTPELPRWGLIENVQSRRLLINAVSGSWQHNQPSPNDSVLLRQGCIYSLSSVILAYDCSVV